MDLLFVFLWYYNCQQISLLLQLLSIHFTSEIIKVLSSLDNIEQYFNHIKMYAFSTVRTNIILLFS